MGDLMLRGMNICYQVYSLPSHRPPHHIVELLVAESSVCNSLFTRFQNLNGQKPISWETSAAKSVVVGIMRIVPVPVPVGGPHVPIIVVPRVAPKDVYRCPYKKIFARMEGAKPPTLLSQNLSNTAS